MTKSQKTAFILDNIAHNYKEFLKQAKYKLYKQRHIVNEDSYMELVSDVIYSVIEKLNNDESLERFYDMALNGKLKLFILKGIDSNTRFVRAPFLRKKIIENNRIVYIDHLDNSIKEDENDEEKIAEDNKRIDKILDIMEPAKAREVFGEDWQYYCIIFKEYIYNKTSYKTIALKYGIPLSSIYFHIRWIKDKIRTELKIK